MKLKEREKMSEYDRMISGCWYTWKHPEIDQALDRPRELVAAFNAAAANDYESRATILRELLEGKIGEKSFIEAPFRCDWGKHITIGVNTFVNYNCVFNDYGPITIGDNVLIGFNVMLITSTHPTDPQDRLQERNDGIGRIVIGNNVWIGAGAMVLPGVTIGDDSVIGAGSVVTRDIPASVIAVGNPCRVIRACVRKI